MGQNEVLTGMVLNAMPIGEYDRRITILTKEKGKITAFARGARRPVSQLLAATTPFSFGEFELFSGRSTYTLVKAAVSNYFRDLPKDPVKACYGFYFLEIADFCTQENNDEKEFLKLLYQTLRALESSAFDSRLVRRIYELRVLLAEGEYPNLFSCQQCGKKENLIWFSAKRHGMVCGCHEKDEDAVFLEESALYTMQYVTSSDLGKLYTFAVSQQVLRKLEKIMDLYFFRQVSHRFRSLEILKTVEEKKPL